MYKQVGKRPTVDKSNSLKHRTSEIANLFDLTALGSADPMIARVHFIPAIMCNVTGRPQAQGL